jgi:hypothetical protein
MYAAHVKQDQNYTLPFNEVVGTAGAPPATPDRPALLAKNKKPTASIGCHYHRHCNCPHILLVAGLSSGGVRFCSFFSLQESLPLDIALLHHIPQLDSSLFLSILGFLNNHILPAITIFLPCGQI